jgi:hypothetical protein
MLGYTTSEYDAAVEVALAGMSDGLTDFEGNNCEDSGQDCNGWDGYSRRCECGNRRVEWIAERNMRGELVAVAVAY